jgi:hypothetical protein
MTKTRLALVIAALLAAPAFAQEGLFGSNIHWITPCRILDTRVAVPGTTMNDFVVHRTFEPPDWPGVGVFHHAEVRRYLAMCGATCYEDTTRRPIRFHATGIVVTVIAVNATAPGHLVLYDSTLEDPWSSHYRPGWTPGFSTVNFQKGAAVANTTFVKLGQDQGYNVGEPILPDLAIRAFVSDGGTVHVVLDLVAVLYDDSYPLGPEE